MASHWLMLSPEKHDGWLEKEDNKLFQRDICCFDFRSNFLVLISILLNFGNFKER